MPRRRVIAVLLLAACGHTGGPGPKYTPIDLPVITRADDLELVLDEHAAIPVGHPQREASRKAISAWLFADMATHLDHGRLEIAFERFVTALHLYEADELANPVPDDSLLRVADRIRAAFAPRGGEQEVLTALVVRLSLSPGDRDALERYDQVCGWVEEAERLVRDRGSHRGRLVEMHETIVRSFPSPFVRDRLEVLYTEMHRKSAPLLPHGVPPSRGNPTMRRGVVRLGYRLGALHLRAGTIDGALQALRATEERRGDDPDARRLLRAASSGSATAEDFVDLALHFADNDADASERVCVAGLRRLGDHPDLLACAAQMATRNGRIALALRRARLAVAARPDWPAFREFAARLFQFRVESLVQRERTAAAASVVDEAIEFLRDTRQRLPTLDVGPSIGTFHYLLAGGYYNTGDVTRAEELYERAVAHDAPPWAYEQLGVIQWRRGRFDEALASYSKASQIPLPDLGATLKLGARLRGRRGDVLRDKGASSDARRAWLEAIGLWNRFVFEGTGGLGERRREAIAMAQVERARLLYELGESEAAFQAIILAMDTAPERGETYVNSVAMLATRSHVAQATEVYRRALRQPEVSDYYKVYCSLWIYDLGRRFGGEPDALALRYLEDVQGDEWHHRLARFAAGQIPYRELRRQADTPGKKAEIFFYEAQNRLAAGKVDEARELWRRVLGTDMMAFFEYDMAIRYLASHSE